MMPTSGKLTTILRLTYYALVALLLIPLGSLDPRPLHLFSSAFFILALVVIMTRPIPSTMRALFTATIVVSCALAGWIFAQTLDIPGNPFANSIWGQAELYFGPMPRSISVAPGDSLEAMIPAILPFVVCLTGLLLFSSDQSAQRLQRFLCLLGAVIAIFGLIEFLLFPGQLLFAKKTAHLDGLTAVFLNKNTAATFLGVTVLLSIALAFGHVQHAGVRHFFAALLGKASAGRSGDVRWTIVYGIAGSLSFVALMMTKSRAGIGSTFLGMMVQLTILAYFGGHSSSRMSQSFSIRRSSAWPRLGRICAIWFFTIMAGAIFARQALLRAEVQGIDDLRFCVTPGILRLLGDNWVVGTGLATFRDVFPQYFDPRCNINYVWYRAHNFYIDGWISLGLPFVFLAVATISILLFILVRGVANRRSLRFVPALGLGVLTIALAHSALDYSLQIPGFAAFWAAALATCLVVATGRIGSQSGHRTSRATLRLDENLTDP